VNASNWEYTAEGAPAEVCNAAAAGAGLRVGLGQLRDVRLELVQSIVTERGRGGLFTGFGDFLRRVPCRFEDIRILIRSGSLDSVSDGYTRPQLFFRWHHAAKDDGFGFLPPPPPLIGDYTVRVKQADELKTLGIVISCHPLQLFRPRLARLVKSQGLSPVISSAEIPRFCGRRIWIAGILVTGKEVSTKKQEPMIFVSFEDEQAIFETVLFPDAFLRFHPLLDDGWAFLVHGKVEEDMGVCTITVEHLLPVSRLEHQERSSASAATPERPPLFRWGPYPADLAAAR